MRHGLREETIHIDVVEAWADLRLDQCLAEAVEDASRAYMQKRIHAGDVTVNDRICKKPSYRVRTGDRITVFLPPPPALELRPEPIPLDILYQDADIVVVNKPAGMVVHPAPGHYSGTLVHALVYHCNDFDVGLDPVRPGIVHRLDRDTTGVLVVAKNRVAYQRLAEAVAQRSFERYYSALVLGGGEQTRGTIDAPIGRSLADPLRMTVTPIHAKPSVTHYEVKERFGPISLLRLRLETGRTHQIRVHLRFAGKPVLGDPIYGVTEYRRLRLPPDVTAALDALPGQALHAASLSFQHPRTGVRLTFEADPPPAFLRVLDTLRMHFG